TQLTHRGERSTGDRLPRLRFDVLLLREAPKPGRAGHLRARGPRSGLHLQGNVGGEIHGDGHQADALNAATSRRSTVLDMQAERSPGRFRDRKSTRLNSSHVSISYAVFCLKKKKNKKKYNRYI